MTTVKLARPALIVSSSFSTAWQQLDTDSDRRSLPVVLVWWRPTTSELSRFIASGRLSAKIDKVGSEHSLFPTSTYPPSVADHGCCLLVMDVWVSCRWAAWWRRAGRTRRTRSTRR